MRKLLIILFLILIMPFGISSAKENDGNFSQIFKLDVASLKYEQKQLVYSIITGNESAVKTILDSDPNQNTTYARIPLTMFAIHANEIGILKMLIEDYKFDPNEKVMGVTPLEISIYLKRYDAIKYLLSIGVVPSEEVLQYIKKSKNKKLKELFE